MTNSNPPSNAATDPRAAAKQDQVKADHDALEESARRVESSVPANVRDTPIQQANTDATTTGDNTGNADDAHANAEAARESARRVEQSTPESVDRGPR